MAKYRVVFANVIKGGDKNGKKYSDFISVFKDMELKKDSTINLQTPAERVAELEENLTFQQSNGYPTQITEDMLKNAKKTVEMGKTRFILSVFKEKTN